MSVPDFSAASLHGYLQNFLSYLWNEEPVIAAWAVNGSLALLLGDVIHITSTQEAAVTTIATGVVALVTALRTTPFVLSAFAGALTTMFVAAATFGLHLSPEAIGIAVAIISTAVSLLLRGNGAVSVSSAKAVKAAA